MVTSSGRLTITMGLCASILYACGVPDRPLNVISGSAPSTGGSESTGGNNSNGGAPSTGGSTSTGARGGVPPGGGGPSGGVPNGGTGAGGILVGTGGVGGGDGPDTTPSVTGPATTTADGTLTNLSGASFVKTSGSLVITSLYVTIEVLSSFNSIQLWGDIVNRGSSIECIPLATLAINGYDILTVANGPSYQLSSGASACLAPGASGAINGIDNAVSATLLAQGSNVEYSFTTLVRPTAVPHPGAPSLASAAIALDSLGDYAVSGNMRAGAVDINGVTLNFFVRDSSGLLRDKLSAYPNDQGTVTANSLVPYESSGTSGRFSRWLQYSRFSEGVAANFVVGPPSEYATRSQLLERRFADVEAARRIIRH